MYHLNTMLFCNPNDLVLSEVGLYRSVLSTLANHVGLVSFLTVHTQSILVAVDGYGLEGQLVGCTEDSDRDLASIGYHDLVELHDS